MRHGTLLEGTPILVVEDDTIQALDIAETLKEAGASIIGPVADLEEAVSIARSGRCGAAVLDFCLRGGDTIALGQELHRRQTPFVIHTGYDCLGMLPPQWQGCQLVSKPADSVKLVHTVAALLRWRRLMERRVRHNSAA